MAGVKKFEDSEPEHNGPKPESFKVAEQGMASGQDEIPSDSTPSMPDSGDATSSIEGCNGDYFPQLQDHGYYHADGSYTRIQSDNGSLLHNMPGYNQYATESFMDEDGQCYRPYFTSSGSFQPAISCGPDALPHYSTFDRDALNGTMAKSGPHPNAPSRSSGWNSLNGNGNGAGKTSTLPYDSKYCQYTQQYTASSNFSNPDLHTQPLKPLDKVSYLGSDLRMGLGNLSSFTKPRQGILRYNGPTNYYRMIYERDRCKLGDTCSRNAGFEAKSELTRGPRAQKSSTANPSVEKKGLGGLLAVRTDQYNRQDFQIQYEMAKFYVIKSYSEDDVQKSIKYDVWASTSNGNKKLDAAFRVAEAKATDKGLKCPIFLFFSVNGSGQFVGLSEMIGPVDFNKDMNFWQLDKWNGFFPVKWHIIKDIPNTKLRHIILENNDNRPVPHSRDTQEIGLKQGLEMLDIFKDYAAKSSILDDFDFYEDQKKLAQAKRNSEPSSPQAEVYSGADFTKRMKEEREERKVGEVSVRPKVQTDSASSLINRTKNLTLDDRPSKSCAAPPEPLDRQMPSTSSKTF